MVFFQAISVCPSSYEERRDARLLVDPLDRFGQKWRDTEYLYSALLGRMIAQRDRVRNYYLFYFRLCQLLHRPAGQNRMGKTSVNPFRPGASQRLCNLRQRAARVAHIVDNQTVATANIADAVHHLGAVRLFPALFPTAQS